MTAKQEQALLIPEHPATIQPHVTPNALSMLNVAVQRGATMEEIKELLALRKELKEEDAREAFNRAFAAFKAESVQIIKNITVTDGPLKGKKYANLFAAVDAVTPALSKHGLSHSWKLTKDEAQWLEVTCTLRHELGHFETVSMGGPPDAGGAKSAIQARASSKSYLERYTLLAITGLASSDGDVDGASLTNGWLAERLEWVKNCKTQDELKRIVQNAISEAKQNKDGAAMLALANASDARKAAIARGDL